MSEGRNEMGSRNGTTIYFVDLLYSNTVAYYCFIYLFNPLSLIFKSDKIQNGFYNV